jgi:N4-gp56 family major capsid protein
MAINNFIPAIWSRSLLENLRDNLVYAQPAVINSDYEGEIAGAGSSVKIHNIGAVTVSDYTKNSDLSAPETLNDGETILSIDRARSFNMQIDDIDQAQQVPKIMDGAMREAAYALAKDMDQYLASIYTQGTAGTGLGTTGTPIVPTSTTAYEYLADAYTLLDEANAPSTGRVAIVPPWFHGLLRKDQRFVSYGTQDNRSTLQNGLIGEAAGFTVLVSNNVFNTSGTKYRIMCTHPGAWTLAQQIQKVEAYRPPLRFADAVKGLNVYGAKVVRPTNLVYMTASKS